MLLSFVNKSEEVHFFFLNEVVKRLLSRVLFSLEIKSLFLLGRDVNTYCQFLSGMRWLLKVTAVSFSMNMVIIMIEFLKFTLITISS